MESITKMPNFMVIMWIMLLSVVFLIYKAYQTPVTGKTFLVTIYLYILLALVFIALVGKYTEAMTITDTSKIWQMLILYFVLGFGGIFMMISDKMFVNHVGFFLLLLALSLIIGVSYKYATNVTQAAAITAVIVAVLTAVVFSSSEEAIERMSSWLPSLTTVLCGVIIVELGYMLFFNYNESFHTFMSIGVIGLFILFILADTSELLKDSKSLQCTTHQCINYPLKASGLVLDYVNIFVRLLDYKY